MAHEYKLLEIPEFKDKGKTTHRSLIWVNWGKTKYPTSYSLV